MKEKILFINLNFQNRIKAISQITVGPPLGLAYLAAMLEQENYNVKIIDANALGLSNDQILKEIREFKPKVIGLSAVTPTINQVHELAVSIKRISANINIILGGVHGSILPEDTLKRFPNFDVIVLNEGENIINQLSESLINNNNNNNLDTIPGIAYKNNHDIIKINPHKKYITMLDDLPFPARHLLPNHLYRSVVSDKFTTMIAMRGCYAKCNYCSVPFFSGKTIRRRSSKNIVKEMIECYESYGTKHFSFLDDTFTTNKKWVHEFCDEIIQSKIFRKITWMCLTRVDNIDENMLISMKKSGCIKIEFGIESGSQKVLSFSKKGITKNQIKNAFRLSRKVNIPTLGFIILNMPGETAQTIAQTKKFVLELDPTFLQISYATPYPGTQLEKYAIRHNLLKEKDWSKYLFLNKIILENKNLSKKQIYKLKNNLEKSFYLRPKYLIRLLRYMLKYKSYKSIIRSAINGFKQILKS